MFLLGCVESMNTESISEEGREDTYPSLSLFELNRGQSTHRHFTNLIPSNTSPPPLSTSTRLINQRYVWSLAWAEVMGTMAMHVYCFPTALEMPLSLRRPKRQPDPLLTADQSRSVSTPTLLSRLRNSTFSRSKASLLSSFAYDTVRSRTPPIPYSPSTRLQSCQPAFREQPMLEPEPKKDKWEERGFNLTREQRECLAGAECLGVWDPITGEDGAFSLI